MGWKLSEPLQSFQSTYEQHNTEWNITRQEIHLIKHSLFQIQTAYQQQRQQTFTEFTTHVSPQVGLRTTP